MESGGGVLRRAAVRQVRSDERRVAVEWELRGGRPGVGRRAHDAVRGARLVLPAARGRRRPARARRIVRRAPLALALAIAARFLACDRDNGTVCYVLFGDYSIVYFTVYGYTRTVVYWCSAQAHQLTSPCATCFAESRPLALHPARSAQIQRRAAARQLLARRPACIPILILFVANRIA